MKSSKTDFQSYLYQSTNQLEKEINKFSKKWNSRIKKQFPELQKENAHFTDSLHGGKMLRGTLVKLGYELRPNNPTKAIIKPALAYEILHAALLIHDDIIDQSPIRRGKRAVYLLHKKPHYGISQAICLGDLGIILANQLIAESEFPPERKNKALTFFTQTITDTILGEMLDVKASYAQKLTEKHILKIHTMKTAQYSIIGPLTLGALLSGASDTLIKTITQFGGPLGIAYQLQDDILGIFGTEKKIGKSTTSDIEENKGTLLLVYALKKANAKQLNILQKYYGKKGITQELHKTIKQVFIDTGALAYSQQKILTLIKRAQSIIPQLSKDKTKQQLLEQFIELLINREK